MTTDTQILTALRAQPEGVSGADLAQRLRVSRAAIWARIEELRSLGYDIEASPHRGYRLLHSPDALHADDLMARLGAEVIIGREIHVFQETGSTNDVMEKLARDGVKEGAVVFAESQSKGRGRLGRQWVSTKARGLWFSVLLRPPLHPLAVTQVTIIAATAFRRAIHSQTGLPVEIKWPNDLLIRGRKVAGILTELRAELDSVKYVILGAGVNVNQEQSDFPAALRAIATSLRLEARMPFSRPALGMALLRELDADYARLREGQFARVAEEWERHCTLLGQHVAIQIGDRRVTGRAEALGEDGALLLRTQHGRLERIIGGDVSLER